MSEAEAKTHETFVLPARVVSRVDVSRLVSEIEWIDGELTAAAVRSKTGAEKPVQPAYSDQLNDFLKDNGLSLDDGRERSTLIKEVRLLKDTAPVIHMTFAVPADHESLQELAQWLRTEIHPQALIAIGLQPALVAGVYLRTPNHIHDLSLRSVLKGKRDSLVKELETLRGQ